MDNHRWGSLFLKSNLTSETIAGIACFFFFLVIYGVTARSDIQVSDEVVMAATGASLVTDGDLAIDEWQWLQDSISFGQIGIDGRLYAKYFPGNIYGFALLYRFAEKQGDEPFFWSAPDLNPDVQPTLVASSNTGVRFALKLNSLLGAIAITILFFLVNRYFDWRTALITALLIGLTTDWWYQSRGFMSEIGSGAFILLAIFFTTVKNPYASGLFLAISILFRPTSLLVTPVWARITWEKRWKSVLSGLFVLFALFLLAYYNWSRFGSFFSFGYGEESFTGKLHDGLYGLLLSPGRSVFVYSPILAFALLGIKPMIKKDFALFSLTLALILTHTIVIALWHSWDGGWSWGSRLLTPIVLILGIFLAPIIDQARTRPMDMAILLIFGLLGLFVQIAVLLHNPMETIVQAVSYGNISYEETVLSVNNSWLALQFRSLDSWQVCNIDAYTLRQWLGCGQ
ncbi:MAG: hypothetical protein JNK32_03700 [Anaerolineales bacterium]|nr:hypothetical protein [Anaerolineales bacterium]